MTNLAILGPLSSLHEMTAQLLESVPTADAARQYHPDMGSLAWYFGRGVYLETYWLRTYLAGDDDLTRRVDHLFTPGSVSLAEQCAALPNAGHLLNWAAEIRDEHLMRLANPSLLPDHPLLANDRLLWFVLQETARLYECMLEVLNQRQLQLAPAGFAVASPLQPVAPDGEAVDVTQGHYRIGARDEPAAYDNELPPQAVQLSNFRIGRNPVSNAEYLAFMQADGYADRQWWDEDGLDWLRGAPTQHPEYWRRDRAGHWFGVGINGASGLPPQDPVTGICRHEAKAFAAWAASLGGATAGAVLQHEYQWEVAARGGHLENTGRVREWCANPFHAYPDFSPFPNAELSERFFATGHGTLKGASLHTQRVLRRASFREHAAPERHYGFNGARLVFPPTAE